MTVEGEPRRRGAVDGGYPRGLGVLMTVVVDVAVAIVVVLWLVALWPKK